MKQGFLKKLGINNKKDLVLLGVFYAVCWFFILIGNVFGDGIIGRIPAPLVYITAAFPFVFFAFMLFFWGLNSFFSFLFRKMSFPAFVTISFAAWLALTYAGAHTAIWLKNMEYHYIISILPVIFTLIIEIWATVQITIYYMFDKPISILYLKVHIPLVIFLVICPYILYKQFQINIISIVFSIIFSMLYPVNNWYLFTVLLYAQLFFYGTYSLVFVLVRGIIRNWKWYYGK